MEGRRWLSCARISLGFWHYRPSGSAPEPRQHGRGRGIIKGARGTPKGTRGSNTKGRRGIGTPVRYDGRDGWGLEPPLDEVLAVPLVRLLMRRDHIDPDRPFTVSDEAQRSLASRTSIMDKVRISEERASYLLLARADQFAVLERRNGQLYNLHRGRREPNALTDKGAEHAVGTDWCDEIKARRLFNEIADRYRDLAEHM